jgi:hypothetical protein
MTLLIILGVALTAAVGYAFYKYKTVAGIKAELAKVDVAATADVKALVAKIKTHL